MRLQYRDILGDGELHEIEAEITTDHPASSYGLPVIVLDDGHALDGNSWVLMGYQIMSASENEYEALKQWLSNLGAMLGDTHLAAATLGRLGGSAKSEAKTEAARANIKKRWAAKNGARGGRPKTKK